MNTRWPTIKEQVRRRRKSFAFALSCVKIASSFKYSTLDYENRDSRVACRMIFGSVSRREAASNWRPTQNARSSDLLAAFQILVLTILLVAKVLVCTHLYANCASIDEIIADALVVEPGIRVADRAADLRLFCLFRAPSRLLTSKEQEARRG